MAVLRLMSGACFRPKSLPRPDKLDQPPQYGTLVIEDTLPE